MTERRLPPALEEKVLPRTGWPAVPESDILDWLYGRDVISAVSDGLDRRIPGLVERVEQRLGPTPVRWHFPGDVLEALRAELGEEA